MIAALTIEHADKIIVTYTVDDNAPIVAKLAYCEWHKTTKNGQLYPNSIPNAIRVQRWLKTQIDKATDYMTPMGTEANIERALFKAQNLSIRIDSTKPVWDRLHYVKEA